MNSVATQMYHDNVNAQYRKRLQEVAKTLLKIVKYELIENVYGKLGLKRPDMTPGPLPDVEYYEQEEPKSLSFRMSYTSSKEDLEAAKEAQRRSEERMAKSKAEQAELDKKMEVFRDSISGRDYELLRLYVRNWNFTNTRSVDGISLDDLFVEFFENIKVIKMAYGVTNIFELDISGLGTGNKNSLEVSVEDHILDQLGEEDFGYDTEPRERHPNWEAIKAKVQKECKAEYETIRSKDYRYRSGRALMFDNDPDRCTKSMIARFKGAKK